MLIKGNISVYIYSNFTPILYSNYNVKIAYLSAIYEVEMGNFLRRGRVYTPFFPNSIFGYVLLPTNLKTADLVIRKYSCRIYKGAA
jgi:hypothetical protein